MSKKKNTTRKRGMSVRKELQYDINLYRLLVNNIPDISLFLFDKGLKFIMAEGSTLKHNNLTPYDFVGRTLSEISDDELVKTWSPIFKTALEGDEIINEYTIADYSYQIRVLPVVNEKGLTDMGMAIVKNITSEKKKNTELNRLKEEAENTSRAKSDFLGRVSHEIRTPLNAIIGFTEQLLATDLSNFQKEYIRIIENSSDHLHSLINDILVLSKIDTNELRFDNSPFRLTDTVKHVHNTLSRQALKKNIGFNFEIDEKLDRVIIGDSFRLRQILLNMTGNAIKFTPEGSVELRCFCESETYDTITAGFKVTDTGIGISPENQKLIFDPFGQIESNITRKYQGTGLGLTICKNLVELQNGKISVESAEGKGSSFIFTIPYRKGKETDFVHSGMHPAGQDLLKNIKILLVEDDAVNKLLGEMILKRLDCIFDTAGGGKEAIAMLSQNHYDVVLLDIHMPGVSGLDVSDYLRAELKDFSTKIIAVTASVMKSDIKMYTEAGINTYLIKPFKEANLINKLYEVMEQTDDIHDQPEENITAEKKKKAFSLDELLKITGNDKESTKNMVRIFIENSERSIEQMEELIEKERWQQIGETAHRILPSLRHLQVENVVKKLLEIKEITLPDQDYEAVPELVKSTVQELKSIIEELKTELQI